MDTAAIGVVVLNYNGLHYTFECIESLFSANPFPQEIILIDNGSTDNSAREFTSRFENDQRITLLLFDKNLGYAGGMNQGIKYLFKNQKIKVILLLNNDTVVKSDFLAPLMVSLEDGCGYHLATPKILYRDGVTIWSIGARVFYPSLFSLHSKGKKDVPSLERPKEINFLTGCAMVIRKEVFEKIGLFDEKYFAYVEDVDFCKRALEAGFRFTYCHKSVIIHKEAGCLGDFSPAQVYLKVRNKAYFIKKNIAPILWPMSGTWYFIVTTFWMFRAVLKGKGDVVRAIFLGLLDFVHGKMGAPTFVMVRKSPSRLWRDPP